MCSQSLAPSGAPFLLMAITLPASKQPVAFGRREMRTLAKEVGLVSLRFLPGEGVSWDVWSESWPSGCLVLREHSIPCQELTLQHPDPPTYPSSFPWWTSALYLHVAQHRPGDLVTIEICIYIKKLLLWGFLYIVFLFVFYSLWRELANCESNLTLLPADIFWLPGKNLCYQGQHIALWSVLHPKLSDSSSPTLHSFLKQIPRLLCYYL